MRRIRYASKFTLLRGYLPPHPLPRFTASPLLCKKGGDPTGHDSFCDVRLKGEILVKVGVGVFVLHGVFPNTFDGFDENERMLVVDGKFREAAFHSRRHLVLDLIAGNERIVMTYKKFLIGIGSLKHFNDPVFHDVNIIVKIIGRELAGNFREPGDNDERVVRCLD